jgi:malate dehydrogenase (oxaloacetate-decarboxylating)
VATGSPFEDVELREGVQRIGQANNVFVFPGLGLGTIVSGASRVSNAMINRAALALSQTLTDEEIEHRCLMPEVTRLWEVCGAVGLAVAEQAVRDGVANKHSPDDLRAKLADYRWRPEYPEFVRE